MKAESGIYFIMGVSGCGKSTLGRALADRLELPFFDADDFHPPANIQKMSAGLPLEDADREQWLRTLNQQAQKYKGKGAVIACSALKETYRKLLETNLGGTAIWVYLHGSYSEIRARIDNRGSHFMPASLLKSQFEALQPPAYGIHVPISLSVPEAVSRVLQADPL